MTWERKPISSKSRAKEMGVVMDTGKFLGKGPRVKEDYTWHSKFAEGEV